MINCYYFEIFISRINIIFVLLIYISMILQIHTVFVSGATTVNWSLVLAAGVVAVVVVVAVVAGGVVVVVVVVGALVSSAYHR